MTDVSTKEENRGDPDYIVDTVAEYSTIAYAYATCTAEDLWTHTTVYTTTNYILNGRLDALKDAAVLDLACGSGTYSRWAVSQGASKVVGVDISEQQIAHAHEIGHGDHLLQGTGCKIEYIVQDASTIDGTELGMFDIVLAVHLLCCAQNEVELRCMLKAASSCLKKGGRFVGVRECLDPVGKGQVLTKVKGELPDGPMFSYELVPDVDQQLQDYCHCKLSFRNSDGSTFGFTSFAVRESTMIDMFVEEGFKINSIGPRLSCSPEGRKLFPPDFIRSVTEDYGKLACYFDVTKE